MKDILERIESEVAKMPKINKRVHDANYAKLVEDAKKRTEWERNKEARRHKPSTEKEEEERRLAIWREHKDLEKCSNILGISYSSLRNWLVRRGEYEIKENKRNRISSEKRIERSKAYHKCNGDIKKASRLLGETYSTLYNWYKKHGVD